jgi:glycine oxidase
MSVVRGIPSSSATSKQSPGPADVAVIGGGVIGLTVAWRLAVAGRSVCVVDPTPGRGAAWVAAGMLAPVSEAHFGEEALIALTVAGAERWSVFAAELEEAAGTSIGYRRCGTLVVAADSGDLAVVEELLKLQHTLGLTAERLTGGECRQLEPALTPGVRGGIHAPKDHQVDNRLLMGALLTACIRGGVSFVADEGAEIVLTADGARVVGTRLTGGGILAAGTVVVAAGCRSSLLAGVPEGVIPPIRPVKGQVLRLGGSATAPLLGRTVRGIAHGDACYLVPRLDGTVVLGATVEERGYDTTVQAGAVYELLRAARSLVPGITELTLLETRAGLRPGSPDNAPFVGPAGPDGLVLATGHYRNGILLAPITADAVTGWLGHGAVPEAMSRFTPGRTDATPVL